MRSLTDLRQMCRDNGIMPGDSREACMDLLREKLGTFDPDVQLDPMKAIDLKKRIDWTAASPEAKFAGIAAEYLNEDHVADAKLDGVRMRLFLGAEANTMNTGRRSDTTYAYLEKAHHFPHIRDLAVPELAGTILDGEMMPPKNSITTSTGTVTEGSLNTVMALIGSDPEKAVAMQVTHGGAYFIAFDVIAYRGESIAHMPLIERRELLELICKRLEVAWLSISKCPVQPVCQMAATAENIQLALDHGFEGVIIKAKQSRYEAGKRPKTWAKVKRMSTGDFFIIGSIDGKGRNLNKVGSLKVAYRDENGEGRYCADVAGFTDAFRTQLTDPDTGKVKGNYIGTVIEVSAQGRSKNDRLRHPLFVRLRPDKTSADCGPECSIDLFEKV